MGEQEPLGTPSKRVKRPAKAHTRAESEKGVKAVIVIAAASSLAEEATQGLRRSSRARKPKVMDGLDGDMYYYGSKSKAFPQLNKDRELVYQSTKTVAKVEQQENTGPSAVSRKSGVRAPALSEPSFKDPYAPSAPTGLNNRSLHTLERREQSRPRGGRGMRFTARRGVLKKR